MITIQRNDTRCNERNLAIISLLQSMTALIERDVVYVRPLTNTGPDSVLPSKLEDNPLDGRTAIEFFEDLFAEM